MLVSCCRQRYIKGIITPFQDCYIFVVFNEWLYSFVTVILFNFVVAILPPVNTIVFIALYIYLIPNLL